MNKDEIKEFLRNKPGYLREGRKRLRRVLMNKGFQCTTEDCRQAIYEVNQELKYTPILDPSIEPKILFYDIEVSYGLVKAWRPSYKTRINYGDFISHPKIICISYKWNNDETVHSLQWDSKQDDKLMVEEFIKVLNQSTYSIGHNSNHFDLPWIRTRAVYHNLEMHPKYTTVDTLQIARSKYKFPSNRLDDLGDYLGLGRKISTSMSLWDRVILNKEPEALEEMIKYCEQDVFLLEKVYDKLKTQELNVVHSGVDNGTVKQVSPYNGKKNIELVKTTTTKAGTVKRLMKCLDTNSYFEMSNTDYQKYLTTK